MEKFIKTKNGTRYPIKPRDFLKGKLASYANEYGLEHVKTIKTSSGETYEIYDSGFGNLGSVDACAILKESIQTNTDKLTSGKDPLSLKAYKVNYKKGSKYLSMIVSAMSKESARKMVESNPDVD